MLYKMALRNLLRNKRRSFALIMTIGLGIGALFLYHGFNTGIMNQYKHNTIHARYAHGQLNTKGYREKVFQKPWEQWLTNYSEIEKELKQDSKVTHIFPRVEFFGMLTNGNVTIVGKGQGIHGEVESSFFTALNIVEGKNLSNEVDGILLGQGLARALDVKTGDRITVLTNTIYDSLNGIDLYVVGVFYTGTREFDDSVFRLPLKQAQTLLDTDKVESIALGLSNDQDWDQVASSITKKFPELEATPFAILDKVYYQHGIDFLKAQFDIIKIIILFIVVLGIFNTVLTSVLERKQEIGNLRANGESVLDVLLLLLIEGIVIGIIGGILGLTGALILNITAIRNGILMPASPGLTKDLLVFIELQWDYAILIFMLGIITSMIGTFLAARKVSRMSIGELLRSV